MSTNVPSSASPRFVVTGYKPIGKSTLVGVFTLRLDPIDLYIEDCLFHRNGDKEWVAFPGKPYQKDGKTTYTNILKFGQRATMAKFQEVMVPRVKAFITATGGR